MTDLDQLTDKFYQTFKYEIIPISHKHLEKTRRGGITVYLLYEAHVTLIAKPHKHLNTETKILIRIESRHILKG